LSRDIFSSSLPLIHRRSTISLSFHRFSAVHTVDSYFCTRFSTVPRSCVQAYMRATTLPAHICFDVQW
ncbi:unnamed protein product, partial [Brassica rapa subsp. trilocularis]